MKSKEYKKKNDYKSNFRILSILNRKITNKNTKPIIGRPDNYKNSQYEIKWTDKAQFIINVILAISNSIIIYLAISQTNSAEMSANAAWTSVSQTEESIKLARQSDSANQIQMIKSTQIADSIMRAQIDLANATKKQIEIFKFYSEKNDSNFTKSTRIANENYVSYRKNFIYENRPYLYYSGINIDTITIGKPLRLNFFYENYGKSPSIIRGIIKTISVFEERPKYFKQFEDKYSLNDFVSVNLLTVSGKIYHQEVISKFIMTKETYNEWLVGKKLIYLHGLIEYLELFNRTVSKNYFCIKIEPNGVRLEPDFYNDYWEAPDTTIKKF